FQNGVPVDSSFLQTRPYSWFLGQPDTRIMPGFDEGAIGMREGALQPQTEDLPFERKITLLWFTYIAHVL
ncbi:MAG: hypothetical protein SGPRY_000571, partial [Prymnesium sp.]